MSTSKHTPGPWAIRLGQSVVEIRTTAGLPIAQTTSGHYWQNFGPEAEANARLIAAAPDMLEALRHAEAILSYAPEMSTNKNGAGPNTSTHHALRLVRAAIAKAEGRS